MVQNKGFSAALGFLLFGRGPHDGMKNVTGMGSV